ncbi:MAG TPA: cell division protein FtsZ [Xanthobacteraceae bacterium]|jgi:cell division protein FtsZ|nr:cell division protein FtsZ [Xanthobacteraceae bacterium]
MSINLKIPDVRELKPRITVFGTGGAGGNAVNNMITSGLQGVDFVVANTDAQALTMSKAERIIQMGVAVTEGLGAGSQPEVGRAAAEEAIDEIRDHLQGAHMVFVTAGMGGGTGTGAAPVVARCAKEAGILTVGVITKPFHFEGMRRMRVAEQGIVELQKVVDTLLIIPNQNLFRVANEKTTFADAFAMADQVLYSGVACITDLMVKEGLINLDFADVRAVMREMGKAMMGTGEASGEKRALSAAEAAISNPLIDDASMKGAKGLLISITGGKDLTLYEVDEAATRIREEVDQDANIIVGATFDEGLDGVIRVSVVATGIDQASVQRSVAEPEARIAELTQKLRAGDLRGDVQRGTNDRIETRPHATPAMAGPAVPMADAIEAAAKAAVAAAVLPMIEDVTIRPIPPKPSLFPEQMALPSDPPPTPRAFIPPAPERTVNRPRRMPGIDELPRPGQAELRAKRGEGEIDNPEKRKVSLLRRLAAVGLGRRDEFEEAEKMPPNGRPVRPPAAPRMDRPIERPAAAAPPPRPTMAPPVMPPMMPRGGEPISDYAKRPSHQGLDSLTRPAPAQPPVEEDQLDIPAFLRRQAN